MAPTRNSVWQGFTQALKGIPTGDEVLREVRQRLPLEWWEPAPGKWRASVKPVHGYRVVFHAGATDNLILFQGSAGIVFRREWFPRALAVELLEANFGYKFGANRLLDDTDGLAVVHSQVCDTRLQSVDLIADIAQLVLTQTEQLVQRLYAQGLSLDPK